jgi:hypothetical protein
MIAFDSDRVSASLFVMNADGSGARDVSPKHELFGVSVVLARRENVRVRAVSGSVL